MKKKKYLYEVRCANSNPAHSFDGLFCNVHDLVLEEEVDEATSDRCWNCNSNEWHIRKTNLTDKEYFKQKLKDPDGTIGYHMIDISKKTIRAGK